MGNSAHGSGSAAFSEFTGGRRLRKFFGTLRPNASGIWSWVDDASHTPLGFLPTITQDSDSIKLTYTNGARVVGALQATPDEQLAGKFFCAASVGLNDADITVKRAMVLGGYIYYNGSWQGGFASGLDANKVGGSLTFTSNHLNVFIEPGMMSDSEAFHTTVTPDGGTYKPEISSRGNDKLEIEFYDSSGVRASSANNNMILQVCIPCRGEPINPNLVTISKYPLGNIWIEGTMEY